MGKIGGFLEYAREIASRRPVRQRIRNWDEFQLPMSPEKLKLQGARCMDCGVPFCHYGSQVAGMTSGCPVYNLIPEFNDLVYRGLWKEALERLLKTNNFPEFTGRICPAPCEGSCVLGINDQPVAIKMIEQALADRGFEEGWIKPGPLKRRTGRKVAIVGSGPAGLACAAQLNYAGHSMTVFERADRPGGLLMYGIPNMKLDKKIVERRIRLMEAEGIRFVMNTEVGKDYPAPRLIKEFDAVVLCGGATKPRNLSIPGRELDGIHFAMDFLKQNTQHVLDGGEGPRISAAGKEVVVIGGGDTGTDCVATSIRHGCRSMRQLEILPKPSSERPADNPWPEWPKTLRTDYGQEEAADLFGRDPRDYCVTAKAFAGDQAGRVQDVLTVCVEWKRDEKGRFAPVEISGTEKVHSAQLVLLAMGFLGPEDTLLEGLAIERDERSNVKVASGKYGTNHPSVFAAGDMRRGQSLVVWAIHEGRGAAAECDEFLKGLSNGPSAGKEGSTQTSST